VPESSSVRESLGLKSVGNRAESSISHFNVQLSQGGLYECIAANEAGQDLRYIQVNVNTKRGDVGELTAQVLHDFFRSNFPKFLRRSRRR
jgi:hypothetical protein